MCINVIVQQKGVKFWLSAVCPEPFLPSYHRKEMFPRLQRTIKLKSVSRLLGRTPRLQARSAHAERPTCGHISTFPIMAALTLQSADISFLNVESFKLAFPLSSFTFIKGLFSFSSLSAIRVVSSAYLRLLIFLPTILVPACASPSPAFLMMYSAYMLSKQGGSYSILLMIYA